MDEQVKSSMQALWDSAMLDAGSAAWVENLYEVYLRNPNQIEPHWREYFDALPRVNGVTVEDLPHSEIRDYFRDLTQNRTHHVTQTGQASAEVNLEYERKQVHVLQLINAYRVRGHQIADLDPLKRNPRPEIEDLSLRHHELSEADYETVFETGSLFCAEQISLREIHKIIQQTYCASIGAEYMHITETEEKRWIQHRLESVRSKPSFDNQQKINILSGLTAAEGLEKYLHTRYVGQKRFSLEGGESLIPVLNEIVQKAGCYDMKEIVIGMAHRGRLNVLINIMGKTSNELFKEFEGKKKGCADTAGDVKYHKGFSSDMNTPKGPVHLALAFNPSHLEIVGPVVEGSVRARQERRNDNAGVKVLPVQIHGDAAFAGQGVVMETLQMSQSRGYSTKGTVHIIVNNQIGFTTSNIQDSRSTYYCTDVAKMVNAPIFHVNGDDPEAVILVTQIALDYRMAFKKDVVIDLVCYRRHGHNEADEPSATQPMMYKKIRALPTTRKLYAEKLINEGVISDQQETEMVSNYRSELDAGHCVVPQMLDSHDVTHNFKIDWAPFISDQLDTFVKTSVDLEVIRDLSTKLEHMPEEFELQNRVKKIMTDRHKMAAGALPLDWGYAETMAYATLVNEGHSVRLSGQDCGRGTFFHRHAVWHNQLDGNSYVPLRNLSEDQGNFLVIDSLLSELAVLAFEYGYATAEPETLVIWEAQFGDFANGAQVVIDQFIAAGEQKWNRMCGLTMLLPHGFEGQGAEHSSARLERYLQLCAQNNIQVCVPTTPSQIFHLLRRQLVRACRKPLIVMTPKSLLRHKLAVSTLEDLSEGQFHAVLDEVDDIDVETVKRVIMCSGKVYYDLLEQRRMSEIDDVVIIRIEELYPFPVKQLNQIVGQYVNAEELIWCQEEPKNQGAWDYFEPRLAAKLEHNADVRYVGREPSSVPAVGSAIVHAWQQKALVGEALGIDIQ
ncbi:MAG: 2-oxoglutarate dehydrogenase E1 component [Gammaproteobacteria bacterium]|nr:2-oxoglutarate dehydrogenase E1 component [Gammaproteobacteria bacterium]MCW9004282.1 2-oxoglutarate dehydrogenase E1 component [Gammaproteobacteria bacterium]MCW9055552.1 2-oxoglutarate dehydrogenase E1 component [Gammaproteobacteria bacterium]